MKKKINSYFIITRLSSLLAFGFLFILILDVLVKGIPHITPDFFSWKYTTSNLSIVPSIITTIVLVFFSILIAGPIGIFTAIYLVEYSQSESKLITLIRLATETLAGIPSIIYGLFGNILFVYILGMGYSITAGILTVSIMILPLIIRSSEEALIAVDDSLRHGSFALGAGKLRTIFKIVIPSAVNGILSGIILAIGRVTGETAALIHTLGTSSNMLKGPFTSSRTMALHMFELQNNGLYVDKAYATGVILLVTILLINFLSQRLANVFKEAE